MSAPEILSTGSCVPTQVVTNEMLAQRVDTSDEWVFSRTGIHSRRHCSGGENGVAMAQAARQALERAGVKPEEVGVCLVATFTPDFASPSTACLLQRELGLLEDTICFDLNAACAGFVYALHTAHSLLSGASRPYALVLGCWIWTTGALVCSSATVRALCWCAAARMHAGIQFLAAGAMI